MLTRLIPLALLAAACNPSSECARFDEGGTFDVTLSEDGMSASLDPDDIARARRILKNELWTNWRFSTRLFELVELEDGEIDRQNLRLFSIFTTFDADIPETFDVGTVPEGWEQGLENFTTADTWGQWPEGPLPSDDEYTVYLEALNPADGNVRCGIVEMGLTRVP